MASLFSHNINVLRLPTPEREPGTELRKDTTCQETKPRCLFDPWRPLGLIPRRRFQPPDVKTMACAGAR